MSAREVHHRIVSTGRVGVPDVRGRGQEEAVRTLRGAGLSVGVRPVEDETAPAGQVIAQSPSGDTLDRGAVVTIEVAVTPPPRPTPQPEQPAATLPPDPTQGDPPPSPTAAPTPS